MGEMVSTITHTDDAPVARMSSACTRIPHGVSIADGETGWRPALTTRPALAERG